MQIKIDFLCNNSILAAHIALDLIHFFDRAHRAGLNGNQERLSFYWNSPVHPDDRKPVHDLFIQSMKLRNTFRWLMDEPIVTRFGDESYD